MKPALLALEQRCRDAHARYNQMRLLGVPKEQIPQRILALERTYQRLKKSDQRLRKKEAS